MPLKKAPWKSFVAMFMSAHETIPVALYGRRVQDVNQPVVNGHQAHAINHIQECEGEPDHERINEPVLPVLMILSSKATSEWIKVLHSSVEGSSNVIYKAGSPILNEHTREMFKVPNTEEEHVTVVSRLVQHGLTETEAEQTVSSRKTVFNKACSEIKEKIRPMDWQMKCQKHNKTSILVNKKLIHEHTA
jgi:hypothetical protein